MLSTLPSKVFQKSSNQTNKNLINSNIRQNWTNFRQIPNPINEGLVLCDTLIKGVNEAKVNPYKLQEQCYINDTMKVALELSANEMFVLGAIYGVTHDSGVGYLTNKYISNATGLSISSIKNYLRKFEKLGLIERKYERNGMKVTRNYSFTEIFFKVSELSGNKCIKRPEVKPEVNECQNLHKMSTKPITTHGQNLSINNTSTIIDNNIPQSILLSNKVNISINTYNKVNTEYSKLKQKVDKKQKTKSTQKTKLETYKFPWPSYDEIIDNFIDTNYKDGQEILKVLWRIRLTRIYGSRKNRREKLKLKNKELISRLNHVYNISKGNACTSMAILALSNKQYYDKEYEPNLKTSIAFRDKLYSYLIKYSDNINSELDENDPRYEKNLELKYKAFDKLSTWHRVKHGLPSYFNNEYTSTMCYVETPELTKKSKFDVESFYTETNKMLIEFTKVNNEKQWTFGMAEQNQKIGDRANCQGVGVPLYNLNGSQKIDFVSHCLDNDNLEPNKGVESYGPPKAKYDSNPSYDLDSYNNIEQSININPTYNLYTYDLIEPMNSGKPTYDIERYEKYNFLDYINNKEDEGLCAYDTCAYNPESTKELIHNEKQETNKKSKFDEENIETPPPLGAAPPSPLGRGCAVRPKLSDLRGVNEEKCKSLPLGRKQGKNGLKTAINEKVEKYEEPDPEFVKKCLERAKANLMRKDE